MTTRGVFFDRDGVLNRVVWRGRVPASPRSLDELVLDDEIAAVARLRDAGFRVFVVTNQPDVARGLMPAAALDAMMQHVRAAIAADDVRCCVHDDSDACGCRKPAPGMLLELAAAWNVDLAASFMVGDSHRDVEAGRAAGCRTILVRRPYNAAVSADAEAHGLAHAVGQILAMEGND